MSIPLPQFQYDADFDQYKLQFRIGKTNLGKFLRVMKEINSAVLYEEKIDPKLIHDFGELIVTSRFSGTDWNKCLTESIRYFREQKEFDFRIREYSTKDLGSSFIQEGDFPPKLNWNKYKKDFELCDIESTLSTLFSIAATYDQEDSKDTVIQDLLRLINELPFPSKYTDRKKNIIVGFIAAKMGYIKTAEEFGDADYPTYLEDQVKYYLDKLNKKPKTKW